MPFDFLSLTEENKKKWKQSGVIAIIFAIIIYFDITHTIRNIIDNSKYGFSFFDKNTLFFIIVTSIILRIVLSTI